MGKNMSKDELIKAINHEIMVAIVQSKGYVKDLNSNGHTNEANNQDYKALGLRQALFIINKLYKGYDND